MPSQVGVYIRNARQEVGIGLRELARRIDKSPAYLVALERGDPPPGFTEATLAAIASELDLNMDLLMTLASKMSISLRPRTPLEVELYRLVRRLPTERQRALLDALKDEGLTELDKEETDAKDNDGQ